MAVKKMTQEQRLRLENLELRRANAEVKGSELQSQLILANQSFQKSDSDLQAYVQILNTELGIDLRQYRVAEDGTIIDKKSDVSVDFPEKEPTE